MKITSYPGENIRTVVSIVKSVLVRLESVYAIQRNNKINDPLYGDVFLKITKIFTTSSNKEFNNIFHGLIQYKRLKMAGSNKMRNELFEIANDAYGEISGQPDGWCPKLKTNAVFLAEIFFKCGGEGHISKHFPDNSNNVTPPQTAKKIPWFRKPPEAGQSWSKKLADGRTTHWCPLCNCWTTSHTEKTHVVRRNEPPDQANVAMEVVKEPDEIFSEAPTYAEIFDNLSQKDILELGKGKVTALLAKLHAVSFE